MSRLLRRSKRGTKQIINELIEHRICDYSETTKGDITLISRRMVREEAERQRWRDSKAESRKCPEVVPEVSDQSPGLSSKASKASKASDLQSNIDLAKAKSHPPQGGNVIPLPGISPKKKISVRKPYSLAYEKLFKGYPNKHNKREGFERFEAMEAILPPVDDLLKILEMQIANPPFEGYNFPFIQKWLRRDRWEDEVTKVRGPTSKSAAELELEALQKSKLAEEKQ